MLGAIRDLEGCNLLVALTVSLSAALVFSVGAANASTPVDRTATEEPAPANDRPETLVVLKKDEMPVSALVVGWVHLYAAKLERHPEATQYSLREKYGLTSGYSALTEISENLNETFNPRVLAERYRAVGLKLGTPANSTVEKRVKRQFASEEAQLSGRLVGEWFGQLRAAGIDPVRMVELIRSDPTFGASESYENEQPDFEELRANDALFWQEVHTYSAKDEDDLQEDQ